MRKNQQAKILAACAHFLSSRSLLSPKIRRAVIVGGNDCLDSLSPSLSRRQTMAMNGKLKRLVPIIIMCLSCARGSLSNCWDHSKTRYSNRSDGILYCLGYIFGQNWLVEVISCDGHHLPKLFCVHTGPCDRMFPFGCLLVERK